jgi:hypothetical protein
MTVAMMRAAQPSSHSREEAVARIFTNTASPRHRSYDAERSLRRCSMLTVITRESG